MDKRVYTAAIFWPLSLATIPCRAASLSDLPEIHWSLFFDAGYARTDTREKYLDRINHDGNWDDTTLGLNLMAKLNNQLSLQGQIFGHNQNDGLVEDWFFLAYQIDGEQQIKVGKIKYPGMLLSEYPHFAFAYPWIRAPQEIYEDNHSGTVLQIEDFKGLSYAYSYLTTDGLELKAQLYGGNEEAHQSGDIAYKKLMGAKLNLEGDIGTIYVSVARANNEPPTDVSLPYGLTSTDLSNAVNRMAAGGWRIDYEHWVSYAEYAHVATSHLGDLDAKAWYAMAGYRFGKWLPHLTRTSFEQDGGIKQKSWIAGIRYDVLPELALKLEYQRLEPDQPVGEPALQFDAPPSQTRVNVYSVGLNYVFQ